MSEPIYNWKVAEKAYMQAPDQHPRVSLKDISIRFGIPYQSVRRYAAKRRWNSRRERAYYARRQSRYPLRVAKLLAGG